MNNQVLFKRISGVNFAKLSSSYTVGAIYFIVSNPSTLSTVGDVKITKGQIWIAKSATEVELYTSGIKSAALVGNTITLEDNLGETTSISLAAFEKTLKDYIDLKTSNVYHFIGSISVKNLNNLTAENKHHGDVWNILDNGTLTIEGGNSVDVLLGDNVAWVINTDTNKGEWDKLAGVVDISGKQNTLVNNDVITVNGSKLTVGVDGTYITKISNKLTIPTEKRTLIDGAVQTIVESDGVNVTRNGNNITLSADIKDGEEYISNVGGIHTTEKLTEKLSSIENIAKGGVQKITSTTPITITPATGIGQVTITDIKYDGSGNVKLKSTSSGIKAEFLWEEEL